MPQVPTGHAIIFSDGRTNSIAVVSGANAKVGSRPLDPIRGMGPSDILLMQLETPVNTVAEAARQAARHGVRVIINAAPYTDLPSDVVALADPLVVPEEALDDFEASGARPASLVVLRGKDGLDWDGVRYTGDVVPDDQVVDTVGATDALVGTLAAALVRGNDRAQAAKLALDAAAANVRHSGSQPEPRL